LRAFEKLEEGAGGTAADALIRGALREADGFGRESENPVEPRATTEELAEAARAARCQSSSLPPQGDPPMLEKKRSFIVSVRGR
jgi:hypothetical protein